MSSTSKNSNNYHQLKNKRLATAQQIATRISNDDMSVAKNSFAAYVAHKPQFEKGSIASTVRAYLARRKQPATIANITEHLMKTRSYKNNDSARRSVRRVMAQLSNWNHAVPQYTEPVSFLLNERSKTQMATR